MQKIIISFLIFFSFHLLLRSQVVHEDWVQKFGSNTETINTLSGPLIDKMGNVFISGTVSSSTLSDYVTIKYNSSGVLQWTKKFSFRIEDRVVDMALDNEGNVCVTGLSENLTGTYDIITIKYNTDGDSLWGNRYNGETAFTMDQPVAMDIDNNNNVLVSGYSFGSTPMTLVTIKYSPQGDSLWIKRFALSGTDIPKDIYADDNGNVYVYGRGTRIIKYDTNGNELWNRIYQFSGSESNKVLTGDASGNIYFGAKKFTSTFDDFVIVKLDPDGDTLWTKIRNGFGGLLTTHDDINAVCLDKDDNVLITGEIYNAGPVSFATLKYSSEGVFQWERNYYDPLNGMGGKDIVCDALGNIYVTGGSIDFITLKYNSAGDSLWSIRYNGPANQVDFGSSIAIDNNSNLYVTGRSRLGTGLSGYEAVTIKYTQTLTGISAEEIRSKDYYLNQNYPNPFNPKTIISYDLKESGKLVSLKVYDVLGNEVAALINERQNSGSYKIEFDGSKLSSSIYFYKLVTENYSEIKRMMLVK